MFWHLFADFLSHLRKGDRVATLIAVFLVLVAAGFAVYGSSLDNDLFWDDNEFFLNNTYVHDWQYFPKFFSENVIAGSGILSNYWRPLLLTVFALEWHAWGDWAPGWHVVNTCFHIADAFLVFLLLLRLFRRRIPVFLASLVFLLHPVQTESVSYANSLGDSLSVFFILIGALLYLHARLRDTKRPLVFYALSSMAYILALLSKETAIVLPGLIVLLEIFLPDKNSFQVRLRSAFLRLAPHIALALSYIILRATILNFQNTFNLYNQANIFTSSLWVRLLTFFRSYLTYVTLIFWPAELRMERSVPFITSLSGPLVILGALLLVSTLFLIIYLYRKLPEASFGLLWFLICLAPTSNVLVPINGVFYEHWLYLPLAGFGFALFSFLAYLYQRFPIRAHIRVISACLLFALFVGLSVRTVYRNAEWQNAITFYEQTIRYNPESYRIWNNLGMAYADANRPEDAERAYLSAVSLDPSVAVAYHNLGNQYLALRRIEDAEENYLLALEKDPGFLFTYPQLLNLYQAQNRKADFDELLLKYQTELARKNSK